MPTPTRRRSASPASAGRLSHRSGLSLLAPALALLLLAGCGAGEAGAGSDAVTVRDSAGLRIVENRAPAWGEGEGWTVADTPSLRLGRVQGEGPEVFGDVGGALRLGDGGIAVLDQDAREIRIFGPDGSHRSTAGGPGEGPGELGQLPRLLDLPGDTLGVWGMTSQRLSRFGPDGSFLDAATASGLPGMVGFQLRGTLADGRLLVSEGQSFSPEDMERGPGIRRDTLAELLVDRDGSVADTLGRFAAGQSAGSLQDAKQVLFARSTRFAVGDDRIFAGDSDGWEVRVWDDSLREEMRIRRSHEPVEIPPQAVEAERRQRLEQTEEMPDQFREMLRQQVENAVANETLPAFADLLVDEAGHLWVRRARLPTEEGPSRWDVFRPDGRWLGTVSTPEGLSVTRVGEDFVLGTRTDELGVDRVELYRLRRS